MDADFQLLLDNTLSVAAQVEQYKKAVIEIELQSTSGHEGTYETRVDGVVEGPEHITSISQVVTIVLVSAGDILKYIAEQLAMLSPIGSLADKHPGLYAASNVLYADGVLVEDITHAPQAKEYIFVNNLPYSKKIESGESSQAPNGVYEVTANEAQKRFPSTTIEFIDYVGALGEHPAIRVIM